MPWTRTTRERYRRVGQRYASDLTEAEWAVIAPLLPAAGRRGRPRVVDLRAVIDALLYMVSTACQWRALPCDFPPRSTVQGYFYRWQRAQVWQAITDALVDRARGDRPPPSTGIIDSQSCATSYGGGPRGLDAAKRLKGRKRHIVTDTSGHLLAVHVHPANVQDCHGAVPLLTSLRRRVPSVTHILADRVYRGRQLLAAVEPTGPWTIEIVQRPDGARGFVPLPRRWVVERTFAWLTRCRRLARDFEASIDSATAWLLIAHIRLLTRRLARTS